MRLISDDAFAILTIWCEAQGESFDGKVAVGEVIRERTRRKYSSNGTIPGTVAKRYQFSAWNDDAQGNALLLKSFLLDDTDPVVVECRRAWQRSAVTKITLGAVLYCNLAVAQPPWARPEKLLVKIGNHSFYKD